ncbi:RNA polymerase sigma factor [Nonomuraea angiospora]|uniref:RNA polymerase sigma-70 factor (ECF subfamily) n=1 Tax=Nonomuraea angiospora TaxID=46172 RepID=A0ABR9LP46_9ACTN|nr:RNA polymerase sigma factor [Nonomuraea angiospora]MBE1582425.1 RNA polymerase sigma-70 factor (ECF subfamily) [Nonomuraea angiospora]
MAAPPDASDVMEDVTVVERSMDNPDLFALLYDRYFTELYRYLAARLGSEHVEDLVADAFLIAFNGRGGFDPQRGTVRSWLYGIATNVVARHRRREGRRLNALSKVPAEDSADGPEDRVTSQLAAQASRPELVRGLKGLAKGDRDAVFLLVFGGLGYEEIATALDIPIGTVGSRINRARKKLRTALGDVNPMREW